MKTEIRTPCFVLDMARLLKNLETAKRVREAAGCKILLATKAFAMPAAFPLMRDYLDGTTASGEYEAHHGPRGVRQGSARLCARLYADEVRG